MRYTDRQIKVGGTDSEAATVLELMLTVERSTVRSVPKAEAPERAALVATSTRVTAETRPVEVVSAKPAATATFIRPYRPQEKALTGAAKTSVTAGRDGSAR
jgi:hypothetical protein